MQSCPSKVQDFKYGTENDNKASPLKWNGAAPHKEPWDYSFKAIKRLLMWNIDAGGKAFTEAGLSAAAVFLMELRLILRQFQ